jgi:hypothetical protein
MIHIVPQSKAELLRALESLPDDMAVEPDVRLSISVSTVGQLRSVDLPPDTMVSIPSKERAERIIRLKPMR